MKQVTINVYEFNELADEVKSQIKQDVCKEIINNNFSAFAEYCPEYLSAEYGIVGVPEYRVDYSQRDGFRFSTSQFLTSKTAKLIEKRLTTECNKRILNILLEKGATISCTPTCRSSMKASQDDLSISNVRDLIQEIAKENPDIPLRFAALSIDAIRSSAVCLYLDICLELLESGYEQYNVTDEEISDYVSENYYYQDGRYYGTKEDTL